MVAEAADVAADVVTMIVALMQVVVAVVGQRTTIDLENHPARSQLLRRQTIQPKLSSMMRMRYRMSHLVSLLAVLIVEEG